MSYSITATETKTFTVTHARHLAAKVSADLKRLQRLYGHITDERIAEFEGETTELLRQGYLGTVTYGFQRDDKWIEPTLRYTASELANIGTDDDPGRVRPGLDITGAEFHSFLTYSAAWNDLTTEQRLAVKQHLPLKRVTGTQAQVNNGYFADDKTYSSGGRSLGRASVRNY
jgi:Bacterial HORMA domain family 1